MEKFSTNNFLPHVKISGIYKIIINSKFYIGSSTSIGDRLKHHLWSLSNKSHHNRTMQNLYNKHKDTDCMYFEILENCENDVLIEREKFYIDSLNPYVNHILDPVTIVRDSVYRERLSKGLKAYWAQGHSAPNEVMVYQYNLDGTFIRSFKSCSEASRIYSTNKHPSAICMCARGDNYTAHGYRWSYKKVDTLESLLKNYKIVPVIQYNLDNKELKVWSSITEAGVTLGISNIARAIKFYPNRNAGGFLWSYINQRSALNPVNSGNLQTGNAVDNPDPSLLRNEFEGATTSSESRTDNNSTTSAGQ